MDRITDTHVYFWGSAFSNWAHAVFQYKHLEFQNSEQAFMWEKAMFFHDTVIADQILENDNPSVAKELGRKVKGFNVEGWMIASFPIMVSVCYEKFKQNSAMRETLLSTGNKTIVEASPYDKIWGVGLHWKDARILNENNWTGMNLLGKALMEVRKMIRDGN